VSVVCLKKRLFLKKTLHNCLNLSFLILKFKEFLILLKNLLIFIINFNPLNNLWIKMINLFIFKIKIIFSLKLNKYKTN
jgi:hypothetical protein